jgi:hypothetical protein
MKRKPSQAFPSGVVTADAETHRTNDLTVADVLKRRSVSGVVKRSQQSSHINRIAGSVNPSGDVITVEGSAQKRRRSPRSSGNANNETSVPAVMQQPTAATSNSGGSRRFYASWAALAGGTMRPVRLLAFFIQRSWNRRRLQRAVSNTAPGSPADPALFGSPRKMWSRRSRAGSPATHPTANVKDDTSGSDTGFGESGSSTDAGGLLRVGMPQDTDAEQLFFESAPEDDGLDEEVLAHEYDPSSDILVAPTRGSKRTGPPVYATYKEHAPFIAAEVASIAASAASVKSGESPSAEKVFARDAERWPACHTFKVPNTEGFIESGKTAPSKTRDVVIIGLGIPPVARTQSGWPAANSAVLKILAGSQKAGDPVGKAHAYFGGGEEGTKACAAIHAL